MQPPVDVCTGGYLDGGNSLPVLLFTDFNRDGFPDMLNSTEGSLDLTLSGAPNPVIHDGSPANAASFVSGAVAPGELVTVFGDNLGDRGCAGPAEEILFNGVPAATLFLSPNQINAEVPWEIAG